MSPRGRFLLATLAGLVLAGLVHGIVVLLIPRLSETDALSRARSSEALDHPMPVNTVSAADAVGQTTGQAPGQTPGQSPARAEAWLPIPDPSVAVGLCAYDLAEGPMRVSARTGPLMMSLAVHGRRGAFYAVTDQAAVRGALDLVVLTRAQYDEALANADPDEVSHDVRIVAPDTRGYVVVRVIAALPSQRPAADAAVQAVSCTVDSPSEDAKPGG